MTTTRQVDEIRQKIKQIKERETKKQSVQKTKKAINMCRIMGLSNATKIPLEKLDEHLMFLRDQVCAANKDGFGYAMSFQDEVFSEKFVDPDDFKGMLKSIHPKLNNSLFSWAGSIAEGKYYKETQPMAVIAHGRTSTNYKGYPEYSHPFYNKDKKEAFIHNGVVTIPNDHMYFLDTPNDSEYLANVFWDKGLKGVQEVSGYYAFLNLKAGGKMEIVKDDKANLYGAYCPTLETYIFATMEYMIKAYAGKFNLELSGILQIKDNSYARVNVNKIESVKSFKRKAPEMAMTAAQEKAFKDYHTTTYSGAGRYTYSSEYSGKKSVTSPKSARTDVPDDKSAGKNGTSTSQSSITQSQPTAEGTTPIIPDSAGVTTNTETGKKLMLVENSKGDRMAVPVKQGGKTETELLSNYKVSRVTGKMLTKGMDTKGLQVSEIYELAILEYGQEKADKTFPAYKKVFEVLTSIPETIEEEIEQYMKAQEIQDSMLNDPFYFNESGIPGTEDYYHSLHNRKGDA